MITKNEFNFFKTLQFLPGAFVRHAVHGVGQVDELLANNNRLVAFVRSGNIDPSIITPKEFEMFYAAKTDLTYEEFLVDITIHETAREFIELPIEELIAAQNPYEHKSRAKY